jgi:hypothetical protein
MELTEAIGKFETQNGFQKKPENPLELLNKKKGDKDVKDKNSDGKGQQRAFRSKLMNIMNREIKEKLVD